MVADSETHPPVSAQQVFFWISLPGDRQQATLSPSVDVTGLATDR